jgi:hypothetical protein
MSAAAARTASQRRPASAGARAGGGRVPLSKDPPPAAMTKSVRLKMAAVQARLRAAQEAQLAAEQADERYADIDRACSARLGPTFSALERDRLTEYDPHTGAPLGTRQLSWYLDSVTSAAGERAAAFRAASARTAADLRARVAAAQSNRPLVMQRASLEIARDAARTGALVRSARAAAAGAKGVEGGHRASAEDSGLFDAEERALLASTRSSQ